MDSYRSSESEARQEVSDKLLAGNSPLNDFNDRIELRPSRRSSWNSPRVLLIPAFLAFLTIYSLALIVLVRDSVRADQSHRIGHLIHSPAQEVAVRETKTFSISALHGNPFKGPPSPELDVAWSRLLMNANLRVSADDLARAGVESIPLEDGSGDFYAVLDVYHQLRCLKAIRHYMYKDIYDDALSLTPTHIDLCIDSIRQSLMCNADLAILGFRWGTGSPEPKLNPRSQHECLNWERIEEWASERSFDPSDRTKLRHPGGQ